MRLYTGLPVIKSDWLKIDEFETGERTKLNFGHTFAHALEKITGLNHGEAVAVGMNIAGASLSERVFFLKIMHKT